VRQGIVTKLRLFFSQFGGQVLLLCIWLFLSGMTIAGALVSGSSYDEAGFEQYLRDDLLNFHNWLGNRPVQTRTLDGTGNALEFLGHAVNVMLGNDQWLTTVSTTAHGIAGRHVVIGILGIYGSVLVFRIARLLTNDRLASLGAATALMAIPTWSGSAFFNPKDIPPAVGLAGLTLLFTKLLKGQDLITTSATGWRNNRGIKILTTFILSFEAIFFVFISVGNRPGVLSLVGMLTLLTVILLVVRKQFYDLISLILLLLLGLYASIIINPLSYGNPFKYFWTEMTVSNHFAWDGVNLVAGHLMRGHTNSWWYGPVWILAQTPVLIELALIFATVLMLLPNIKDFRRHTVSLKGFTTRIPLPKNFAYLPTIALLALPLAYAIFFHPVLYNASRHLMMVYPVIAVLFGLSVHKILRTLKNPSQTIIVSLLLVVSLLAPAWEALGLFPYNYVYINPVARLFGTNGHWEFDYWKLSLPEAVKLAPPSATSITIWPYPVPADHPTPYWIVGWIDPNFLSLPPSCQQTFVTRPLGLSTIKLSYIAVCTS